MREAFYVEEFDKLAAENPNFKRHLALSDPRPRITGPATPASSTTCCTSTTSRTTGPEVQSSTCAVPDDVNSRGHQAFRTLGAQRDSDRRAVEQLVQHEPTYA